MDTQHVKFKTLVIRVAKQLYQTVNAIARTITAKNNCAHFAMFLFHEALRNEFLATLRLVHLAFDCGRIKQIHRSKLQEHALRTNAKMKVRHHQRDGHTYVIYK